MSWMQGVIECPDPDKDIRRFDANLRLFPPFTDNDFSPITINNTLLQSCYLRNTEWACGVAVYTGIKDGTLTILVSTESQLPFCQVKELLTIMCSLAKMLRKLYVLHLLGSHFQVSLTLKLVVKKQWLIVSVRNVAGNETKLGMSKGLPEPKLTAADGMVDKLTGAIFAFQLVVVLILGVAGNTLQSYEADKMWYVRYPKVSRWYDFLVIPLRFELLCSIMIPISIKVSLDLAKSLHSKYVDWDVQMYDSVTCTPAVATK
jgi:magnesium-transporting ATPase (P-type)